jgi:membrane protein DedA with SNARE-associated domain
MEYLTFLAQYPELISIDLEIALRSYGYLIGTVLLLANSIPGASFLIPEELILVIFGFYVRLGYLNPAFVFFVAYTASLIGNIGIYLWSYFFSHKVSLIQKLRNTAKWRDVKSVALNDTIFVQFGIRLSSTTRSIVSLISGFEKVSPIYFFTYEASVALVRTVFYLLIGYFIAIEVEDITQILDKIIVFIFFIILLSIANSYFTRKISDEVQQQASKKVK